MLMFTLAIPCLTTSNLSWFTDLTFQVPMQYCSLQHQTLLPSPVTSTAGHFFHFGSASSFFLELFLCSSPVAYWAATDLGLTTTSRDQHSPLQMLDEKWRSPLLVMPARKPRRSSDWSWHESITVGRDLRYSDWPAWDTCTASKSGVLPSPELTVSKPLACRFQTSRMLPDKEQTSAC